MVLSTGSTITKLYVVKAFIVLLVGDTLIDD